MARREKKAYMADSNATRSAGVAALTDFPPERGSLPDEGPFAIPASQPDAPKENRMGVTLLKLVLTPLLIAGATLAARRWGPTVGGWIVGLPLTSGPVSVFLAVEQGRDFAAISAHSTLDGLLSVIIFCLVYERCARTRAWPFAAAAALSVYFAGVAVFSVVFPPLWLSVVLDSAVVTLGILAVKPATEAVPALAAPAWDLPFRMLAATALVVAVTTISGRLGPQLSGLLAMFPVFITVMAVFSHSLSGTPAVREFVRGVIVGSYAFAVFFLVVVLTVQTWNLAFVYLAASACALGTNAAVYRVSALMPRRQ